jgi:hypothetical protein
MASEHIILKWCGAWVLHETGGGTSYPSKEAAEQEASTIDTDTLVLSVSEVAEKFGAPV